MKRLVSSLTPEDILAFIIVIACLVMKYKGVNSSTENVMTIVIGYRFGHHASLKNKNKKEK